jgi:predicted metal-dependent enzyme (double-stranded beta helix superfamily)
VLAECVTERDWLTREQLAAGREQYVRHILHADAAGRYTIVAIIWRPGQRSSIHAHYAWSGAAVYCGELSETIYRVSRDAQPCPVSNIRRRPGDFTFHWPLNEIHHVGNESAETAISIHVYGVGCEWLATGVNRFIGSANARTQTVQGAIEVKK